MAVKTRAPPPPPSPTDNLPPHLPNSRRLFSPSHREHDVGRYDSRSSAATLYVVRLLCRVEEVITLLLQQADGSNTGGSQGAPGAVVSGLPAQAGVEAGESGPPPPAASSLSRLRPPAATEQELRRSKSAIRAQLDGSALPMLQAWFTRAMREHQVRLTATGGRRAEG
eukprot:scaffold9135_cov94-Isochrysis_galbana.AAC.1